MSRRMRILLGTMAIAFSAVTIAAAPSPSALEDAAGKKSWIGHTCGSYCGDPKYQVCCAQENEQ
mgnify:FL=1|jgi:hypothetical protein